MTEHKIRGLAARLAEQVGDEAERTHQPVPMVTIRAIARVMLIQRNPSYIQDIYYVETHYYEHAEWFIRFTFRDGSVIVFSDCEDI